MGTVNQNETFWEKWGISLSVSIGVALIIRIFTHRVDIKNLSDGIEINFFNQELIY